MTTQPVAAMKNLKTLDYGGASSVHDPIMLDLVYDICGKISAQKHMLNDLDIQDKFLKQYQIWIHNTKLNFFSGLDKFPVAVFSNGTTEAFDKFYLKNHTRRFRCLRGEYMYHMAAWRNYFPDWKYIDDEPLMPGDAVVMSMPFSDLGSVHDQSADILAQCDRLGIPVLIDCAFFGVCQNIEFDFDHPCITDITFSLSKSFPVANLRVGMRLTRHDDDDSLLVHHKTNYTNRLACAVGLELLEKFSADYNVLTWKETQSKFCDQLKVDCSNTVLFGLGDQSFSAYNRGGATNRLCFSKYLHAGKLPND